MERLSVACYDNATNEFTSVWIDNLGTDISISDGKFNKNSKTINCSGTMVDPTTKSEMMFRETVTFINENTQKIDMFNKVNGQEYKQWKLSLQIC